MRYPLARIKGLGFIMWHARHELYHALLGVAWAWFLREQWHEFSFRWLSISIFGSLLPDVEHLYYFFTYGKADEYSRQIVLSLKRRQWRFLATFIETGHKYNTDLAFHNIYVITALLLAALTGLFFGLRFWVILFGAMIIHYLFDIMDDIITLGHVNPNWKRWGRIHRKKKKIPQPSHV
jgi:hypothetical protein